MIPLMRLRTTLPNYRSINQSIDRLLSVWIGLPLNWRSGFRFFQVRCWNAASGCNFVGSLKSLPDHFHGECRFHTVTCSLCRATVLKNNIVNHKANGCNTLPPVEPTSFKDQNPNHGDLDAASTLLELSGEGDRGGNGADAALGKMTMER